MDGGTGRGLSGGAEEVAVGVVDEGVSASEDVEWGESLKARGCGRETGPALGDRVCSGAVEAGVGAFEAAMNGRKAEGDVLATEALDEQAETVGLQAMAAVDGAVEAVR
jgi:hypothetical protein